MRGSIVVLAFAIAQCVPVLYLVEKGSQKAYMEGHALFVCRNVAVLKFLN